MSGGVKRNTYAQRPPMVEAINEVRADEGVDATEALHLLVKWGRFLRNAAKEPGTRILIERDGEQTEVVFL